MTDLLVWIAAMASVSAVIGIFRLIRDIDNLRKDLALVKANTQTVVKSVTTRQNSVASRKVSVNPPGQPRPKAEQHYEGQGTPRQEPGSAPRKLTASGTAVRIGSIKRVRAGGSTGDPESS